MLYLLLLDNPNSTSFADHLNELTVIKFVSSKDKFIIGQLVETSVVVALETYYRQQLLLHPAERLQLSACALAGCAEVLG